MHSHAHSLSPNDVLRIERAEEDSFLTLYAAAQDTCGTHIWQAGGIHAVWSPADDDPGFSCVINLGDAHDPEAVLQEVERSARAAGVPVLGVDGSPAVTDLIQSSRLQDLGFEPHYQEHFWGQRIEAGMSRSAQETSGVVERITADVRDTFARVLNIGYDLPGDAIRGHVFASTIGHAGWTHYLVSFNGEPGAASVLYVTDGVAQLFVTTTMPQYRGRGAQTALIRTRLADGQAAGCDLATSQTVVDNASPRNMHRHGFERLYDRWIFGKQLG